MLVFSMRETPTDTLMLKFYCCIIKWKAIHQVALLQNSKMSELGYYRHVHYTLALMCAKHCRIIVCILLDIRENVLLDTRENVVASFFGPSCIALFT